MIPSKSTEITKRRVTRIITQEQETLSAKKDYINSCLNIDWRSNNTVNKIEIYTIAGVKVSENNIDNNQLSLSVTLPQLDSLYVIKTYFANKWKLFNV